MSNQHAIIILGMHRSGTSALTRVLNLLGMELGQPLLPPHATNVTGFWEHAEIVAMNEQILQLLGSTWDDANFLQKTLFHCKTLNQLQQQAAKIIYRNFSTCPLWGIKDPRICRLLPFWLPVFADTGCQLHFILMARHPFEVTASLQQRDDFKLEKSLKLWLTHLLNSEHDSRYHSRVFVTYQELLTDWRTTVIKIADRLKIHWLNVPENSAFGVEQFLSNNLKHHDYQDNILKNMSNPLLQLSQSLYCHFQHLTTETQVSYSFFDSCYQQLFQQEQYIAPVQIHLIIYIRENLQNPKKLLQDTLQAFQSQCYPHCFLSIIANLPITTEYSPISSLYRFKSVKNQSIEQVIEQEIKTFHADWVALVQAGDTFEAELFSQCAEHIRLYPYTNYIYVDESILTTEGRAYSSHLKPDINLYLLRSMPYIGHFGLVRREILHSIGGYQFNHGWENIDICFKVIERTGESTISHIPQLLYHQPRIPSEIVDFRPLVQQHLDRQKILATVYKTDFKDIYRVNYQLLHPSLVSIIIATRNEINTLQRCLLNILKITHYAHYEIIVIDNASDESFSINFDKNQLIYLLRAPQEMPLSVLYNQAAQQAHGEFLLFLNDDIEITQPEWLEQMLSMNQQVDVGIVGVRIVDLQHTVLQAGYVLGMGKMGVAGHIHQGLSIDELGYHGRAQAIQQFSALSDNAMMIKKDLYQLVGGMDQHKYPVLFSEVDLCLKVTQKNYKVVWTPWVTLQQNGVGSMVRQRSKIVSEAAISFEITNIYQHWLPKLTADRHYHPYLSLSGQTWQPEIQLCPPWQLDRNQQKSAISHQIPRIVAFSQDTQAVGEYRVLAPLRMLQTHDLVQYTLMSVDVSKTMNLVELERLQGDVLLLHNFLHNPQLNLLRQCQKYSRYFRIFGQDDLGYAIPQYNPYYHSNYKDIKSRIDQVLRICDRLIVTTEPLAAAYHHCINDISIIPNYIELSRWQNLSSKSYDGIKPRVGWAGAAQHLGDLQLIESVVKKLSKQVDWIFFGMCPKSLRPYLREYHPMVSFVEYPRYLASLNLDLAIAPLENNAFNEAKSNLRLLEYGILGYPVVCSDIYPYQNAPVTRVKNTEQAWYCAILEHLYNQEASLKQGAELRRWVLERYLLENHLHEWERALNPATTTKYRFEPVSSQVRWIFILSPHINATETLKQLLNQHIDVNILSASSIRSLQLPKEVKNPYLWTEHLQLVSVPNDEKNLELLNKKQQWYRQACATSVTTCIISDIPADIVRALILQQHFSGAFFIYISSEVNVATLALYLKLKQFCQSEPLLLQRATMQCLRSDSLFKADRSQLQNLLEIDYAELFNNPKDSLEQVTHFVNLSPFEFIVPQNILLDEQVVLTAEQQAVISTVCQSITRQN